MTTQPPSRISLLQYSLLALPLSFAGLPLYVHAPDFYTRDIGLNIGLIGIILLVIRLFDAIQDPVIGYLSDKHASKRFAIIMSGAAMLIAGMASVFYGPQASINAALWFALSMILATTGFSVVTINLNMIGGFWSSNPQQRTRISAWREAFALTGLLVASVLPAALQNGNVMTAHEAFRVVFFVFAAIMSLAIVMFTCFMLKTLKDHTISKSKTKKGLSFIPILFGTDRHFYGICFLTHLAASMPAVLVLFFIRDYLQAENFSGLFLLFYFISGAALISVWVKIADKRSKEEAWLLSMLLAVAVFIWAWFLRPGDVIAYGVICVLSGAALGADLALPPSILADRVTRQSAQGEATQYFALLAFIPKATMALASGISFLALDHLVFVAGANNDPAAMIGLVTLYALIPCLVKLAAAFYLWRVYKYEVKNT
ncbi:MAG: MFS transporter [Alphaproteobacteria bacterium]